MEDLRHAVPYRFNEQSNTVLWTRLTGEGFVDPFFNDTIRECRRQVEDVATDLQYFLDMPVADSVAPSVFIFHVSRCGSTLITQMLAQSTRNIVLSEPTLINDLLLSDLPLSVKQRALLKAVEILGERRNGEEDYLIIKTDCWHLLFFDLIRSLFPNVPVIFSFREPLPILLSHRKFRGQQMVPGLLKVDLVEKSVPVYDLDAYAAAVLERLYTIMYEKREQANVLLDYRSLPNGVLLLLDRLGLDFSASELARMLARASMHSKDPFSPVTSPGRDVVDERLHVLVNSSGAASVYEALAAASLHADKTLLAR